MLKYKIEGNINFQDELYKLLDEDSENEDELCQITGLPLKDKFVTLECNHHFNYDALYNEIYKQKYVFNTYCIKTLSKKDFQKLCDLKLDYFIKCPYCRNIQFTVLPYYEELGLKEIYGINSLDNKKIQFKMYGVIFKFGFCCEEINSLGDKCREIYVSNILNTQLSYCKYHYKNGIRDYKRKLLLEREANGLLELKEKKQIVNVIEQENLIMPDQAQIGCNAILKFGPNKGKYCGCKKININSLCNRHCPKDKINL